MSTAFKDRIRELRRVPARDLKTNPSNWRTHPSSQRSALRAMLEQVGWAGAAVARELPDGSLELVDGHLRSDLEPDALVPTLIVDLDDDEAKKLLLTMDPIAAMAEADKASLKTLMDSVSFESDVINDLIEKMKNDHFSFDVPSDGAALTIPVPQPQDAGIEAPITGIRVIQLFLDEATHKEFLSMEGTMRGILQTTNMTDTIFVVLKQAVMEVKA